MVWNQCNFVGFMWILSLVGLFKATKKLAAFAGDLPVERLVRLFVLNTWRGIKVLLLDLCGF